MIIFVEGPELSEGTRLFKNAQKSIDNVIFYDTYEAMYNLPSLNDFIQDRNRSIFERILTVFEFQQYNNNSTFVVHNGLFYLYTKALADDDFAMVNNLQKIIHSNVFRNIKLINISKDFDTIDINKDETEQYIMESRIYNKTISDNIMYLEDINRRNEYKIFLNETQLHMESEFVEMINSFVLPNKK